MLISNNHAPINLKMEDHQSWGPKPFRMIEQHDFKSLVEAEWKGIVISGCGSFVIKEKLKLLKNKIKAWKSKYDREFVGSIVTGLRTVFSREEIRAIVMSCGADKSPGPDGYNFIFIQ
ncbi:hypothetical protein ACS0TY_020967 [Phlomoides rotata]